MLKIYQLINHPQYIKDLQNASQSSNQNFGLQITDGLCGSAEWWNNIQIGKLKKFTLKGKIIKLYWTAICNDTPAFDMMTDNGEIFSYNRKADNKVLLKKYKEGGQIEIDYVLQKFKDGVQSYKNNKYTEITLEIRMEEI